MKKLLKYLSPAVIAFLVPAIALAALSNVQLIRNSTTASEYLSYTADKLGIGTTTPYGQLSVNPNGIGSAPAFVVGSSTQTLLTLTNAGALTVSGNATAVNFRTGNFFQGSNNVTKLYLDGLFQGSGTAGIATLYNSAGNDFKMLSFGGTSSSFPGFFTNTGTQAISVINADGSLGGRLGVGTTTPFAKLSVHADNGETLSTLFAVASSTATATTTLFSVDNTGIATALTAFSTPLYTAPATNLIVQSSSNQNVFVNALGAGSVSLRTNSTQRLNLGATGTTYIFNNEGNTGIGTSTPSAFVTIATPNASTGAVTNLFLIASSTPTATSTLFVVDNKGHVSASSTAPTVSSGSVDGTDQYGRVLGCSSACTVTFAVPYTKVPVCIVQPESGSVANTFSYTPTATTLTVTETGLGTFDYMCRGQ